MAKKKKAPTPDWKKKKPPIRLKTFPSERKKISKLVKEEKSIYPRRLRVSQEDIQKRARIKELKKELTTKRLKETKRVAGEAAARVESMAAKKLKQRAISRRVLKRSRATVVIRERESAPYIPIFFKR